MFTLPITHTLNPIFNMNGVLYHNVGEGQIGCELEGVVGVGHAAGQVKGPSHVPRPYRHPCQQATAVAHATWRIALVM
jgi:hypothetical protein